MLQNANAGLRSTFNADYYDHLCRGLPVEVQFQDDAKGKRLVARTPLTSGELVLKERGIVVSQTLSDRRAKIPLCGNCLASLESACDSILRLRDEGRNGGTDQYALPLIDHPTGGGVPWGAPRPPIVKCRNAAAACDEIFCSDICEAKAWARYHQVLCPSARHLADILAASWVLGGVDYGDHVLTAAVALAHAVTAVRVHGRTFAQAWEPLSYFISVPFRDVCQANLEGQVPSSSTDEFLQRVRACFLHMFSPTAAEEEAFQVGFLSRLLGMLLLNIQGQGLYPVGAMLNHSCEPNIEVGHNPLCDEELVLWALCDIPAGAELCQTYVDPDQEVGERQEALRHYLFDCRCVRCVRELADQSALGET